MVVHQMKIKFKESHDHQQVRGNNYEGNIIGEFIIAGCIEGSLYRCINICSHKKYIANVTNESNLNKMLILQSKVSDVNVTSKPYDICIGKPSLVIYEENYGDLLSYYENANYRISIEESVYFIHQIIKIIDNCLKRGIILKDLKMRRFVFIDKERTQLRLETLDESLVESDGRITIGFGFPWYFAPELLNTRHVKDTYGMANCWTIGVIFYKMLFGRFPFNGIDCIELFDSIKNVKYDLPERIPIEIKSIFTSLFRLNPEERLTTNELLSHACFESVESDNFYKIILQKRKKLPTGIHL